MYINSINDRQELGFSCIKDIDAIKQLSNLKSTLKNPVSWVIRKGKQSVVLIFSKEVLVAVLIYVESISGNINPNLYDRSFSWAEVYQSSVRKPDNFVFLTASSQIPDFILKLKGGSDELTNEEQERLVKSILAKVSESNYQETSPNKFLKRVLNLMDPVISNQRLWRVLSELEKPWKPELSDGNHISSTDNCRRAQTVQNKEPKSKGSSSIFVEGFSTPRTLSPMQKRVKLRMAQKEPTTSDLFSADSVTGEIQNINIAFNQFKQRMTQIGNQYTGEKQEYFFEQLNQCEIDRFKALSTEKGRTTIYNVREAETMLQSEFEGFHEPNSITRPTEAELQEGNVLDGRFRKRMLGGESNSINEQYTDVDAKLLVSDKTLQHQADQRKMLGHRNPNKISMYEQGKDMGSSIVDQKHKHCNPNKPELPSSPDTVKHIVNALELIPSETEIAKAGVLDGTRIAWSEKLNVPESSISDQTALQGIIFLNEDCTIERVN